MIFDKEGLLSDAQAIVATAASTNYIDLGATGRVVGGSVNLTRDIGKGKPLPLRVSIVEAFNNLTSLTIDVQVDDNTGFATPKSVGSIVVPLAQLAVGYVPAIDFVPPGTDERYMRLNYTVTGAAPTLGKITAGIVAGHQHN
jgi:hypothetical protein